VVITTDKMTLSSRKDTIQAIKNSVIKFGKFFLCVFVLCGMCVCVFVRVV